MSIHSVPPKGAVIGRKNSIGTVMCDD